MNPHPLPRVGKRIYPGLRIGKLVVAENIESSKGKSNKEGLWKCKCDCGTVKMIHGVNLRPDQGSPRSCGCSRGEFIVLSKHSYGRKYEQTTIHSEYCFHKHRCVKRGLSPIIKSEWEKIVKQPCFYCGKTDIRTHYKHIKAKHIAPHTPEEIDRYMVHMNGIDRIDSSKGYEPENCVPCCGMCNLMKNNSSQEEFLQQINSVYEHRLIHLLSLKDTNQNASSV